ncbi:MAG: tetratricopeptide repeat protein [Deltaproteobacteria bacterium]|nr:tetratricopeptide repeat protein [Deltaproteobacteria bacterium]
MPKAAQHFWKNRDWAFALLLVAATFLAYQPAWNGQPVWDDAAHMTKPTLRSVAGLASIWTQLGATQQYYPLVHTVFWLEYRLWGESTVGYHLLNILLHSTSALLLVAVLGRLRIRGAWLAAGIFALHPVMVESVAWITELKNTLSGVLYIAAALAYLSFDDNRETRHYATALLLFALGLLAKSAIATLPAALLVVFWWKRGTVSLRRDVMPLTPFFVIGAISGLFTAWVERAFIGAAGGGFDLTFAERCLVAGRAVWFYIYKLVWPANLIFIYPRWSMDSIDVRQYLFPAALVLFAGPFWVLRHRSRTPLAVLLLFVITLFPALGFFNVYPFAYSYVADHFQYLATIAPITVAAACLAKATDQLKGTSLRWLRPAVPGTLLLVLSMLSWKQSHMYSDAETLYRTTMSRNASCWMAYTHLGLLLMETGRHDEAMDHLLKALVHHPQKADAHANLGLLFMDMGRAEEAATHLRRALEINPRQADAHNNIGALLARNGRPEEGMAHLLQALELHPDHAEVHYNVADLLASTGRIEEAMVHYRIALELHPEYADAYNNLGLLLAKRNRHDEAMGHFRKALQLDAEHANAHNNLGVMLAGVGEIDAAILHYRRALKTNPGAVEHLDNLVSALLKKGHWIEANGALQHALALARSAGDQTRANRISEMLTRLSEAIKSARAEADTQ